MCVKTAIKTIAALGLTAAGFVLLSMMFSIEQTTVGGTEGFKHYFSWAYLSGLLMLLAGVAYVLVSGDDETATLDESHRSKQ